jgi:putative PIN family toxin of toxin-antitoxin system
MRIVLDTNVLVSGLMNPNGAPGRIVDLILGGQVQVLYDDRILGEYLDVLERPQLKINPVHAEAVVNYLRLAGERVTALPIPGLLLTDEDDLPFVEVAVSGKVDLVTGNTRHFSGVPTLNIKILSPAQFLSQFTL